MASEEDDAVVLSEDDADYKSPNKRSRGECVAIAWTHSDGAVLFLTCVSLQAFSERNYQEIRVHDFMTYAGEVTITPGPRLNLVLGPNGTGKSSLVCAICVGLGGSTKLLGRADNLADYIRRGKNSCWTEITLSDGTGGRGIVLKRDIRSETTAEGGAKGFKSFWKLNGKECSQKDVKELVASLNIQFENLCQFLPQDKVSEFAGMNAKELLVATEKAIGDAKLYRLHMELIEKKKKYNEDKQGRDNEDKQLQKLKLEQQKQQREYERFEQRETLKQEIELLQGKLLWLHLKKHLEELNKAKANLKEAQEKLAKRKGELQEDTRAHQLEGTIARLGAEKDTHHKALQRCKRALEENSRAVDQEKTKLDDTIAKRGSLRAQSEQRARKLGELRASIQQLQTDIENAPTDAPQHMHDKASELNQEMASLWSRQGNLIEEQQERRNKQLQLERQITNLDEQLRRLGDVRQQRLRKLEQKKPGVEEVYRWIQEHRDMFRSPVLGPLAMEMNCSVPEYAGYLETQVGNALSFFLVGCREDETTLTAYLGSRNSRGSTFSVAHTQLTGRPLPHPLGEASSYAHLGVVHTLDEVFEAPESIKQFLCDNSGINRVYICRPNSDIDAAIAALPGPTPGNASNVTLYMAGTSYKHNISAYNQAGKSKTLDYTRPAHILAGAIMPGIEEEQTKLQAEKRRLEQERQVLDNELQHGKDQEHEIKVQYEKLRVQKQALEAEILKVQAKRSELQKLLKLKQVNLSSEMKKPDPLAQEEELMRVIKGHADKLKFMGEEGCKLLHSSWEAMKAAAGLDLSIKEAEMQAAALREASERRRKAVAEMEQMVDALTGIVARDRQAAAEAKARAHGEAPLNPELEALLKAEPFLVEEVEEEIREKEVEMDAIACANPNVLREYQKRQRDIDALDKSVLEADTALAAIEQELTDIRGSWLPELTSIVDTINASFAVNFAEIGCAGEVVLEQEKLREEKYEECALEIRVQFRESEKLEVLTTSRQSGGERSVSTLLFLIALQGVTVTPFRVIDEINQGMDPINERKVFTQLVESACRRDTPQCFLLTPKLLPGLHFTPDITILQIMNGPHIHTELPPMLANKAWAMFGNRGLPVAA